GRIDVGQRVACLRAPLDRAGYCASELAVRTGANAEVVAEGPVAEVVAAATPGLCIGGHFIAPIPVSREQVPAARLDLERRVLVRQQGRGATIELRSGFERQ